MTRPPRPGYVCRPPPLVQPANAASRAALDGQPLGPTQKVGGYVNQPPSVLTTLAAASAMTSRKFFDNPPARNRAPISVIRVRVTGVTGPDDESLERIRRVATAINRKTGLEVDVVAGSSSQPQLVQLPAGKFGQPPLLVEEGWSRKGVAVSIISAVDRKSAVLFGLVLVVTAAFLANAAFATVRQRRTEMGVLVALGWRPRNLFGAVLGELAVIGAVAGLAGAGLAAVLVDALELDLSLSRVLFVPPVALLLAVVAGLVPAWRASRARPLDTFAVGGREPRRRLSRLSRRHLRRRVRGLRADRTGRGDRGGSAAVATARLVVSGLARRPGRMLVAAGALAVSVAALTGLIGANLAFSRVVTGTLLGDLAGSQARGVDYLSVALAMGLAGVSVADILVLNTRERAPELAVLKATGWGDAQLARLTGFEALAVAVAGSLTGALLGAGVGLLAGAPPGPLAGVAALTAATGMLLVAVASLLPAWLATRPPAAVTLGR